MNLNQSGIYTITSPSGKQYVGSAANFRRRWKKHRVELKTGNHHNKPLGAAFKKYGLEKLTFSVLLVCSKQDLLLFEQRAIDVLLPAYNMCKVAGSCLGRVHSQETRAKIALSNTGKTWTPEQRAAFRAARVGHKHSAEHRAKISKLHLGRKRPMSTRMKISAAHLGRKHSETHRANNSAAQTGKIMAQAVREKISISLKGRERSAEWCANISASQRGRIFSDEHRENLSRAHMGLTQTPESRAKKSMALTGRKHSDEARARMSVAAKAREEAKRLARQLTTCSDT